MAPLVLDPTDFEAVSEFFDRIAEHGWGEKLPPGLTAVFEHGFADTEEVLSEGAQMLDGEIASVGTADSWEESLGVCIEDLDADVWR